MSQVLTSQEIAKRLETLSGWKLGEDGQLHCVKIFKDFAHMLLYVNAVGLLAETVDHHPDLFLHSYKKLMISLMTHDQGGITDRDFHLIAQIEALPQP